jgi:hypothetical protein
MQVPWEFQRFDGTMNSSGEPRFSPSMPYAVRCIGVGAV